PGYTCRGAWQTDLSLECTEGSAIFAGIRFTPARNTLETEDGSLASDDIIVDACGAKRVLAASDSELDQPDSVTAFDPAEQKRVSVSAPAEFNGPVTALWPAPNGAIAVVRNLASKRYEAYRLTIPCPR